MSEKGYTINDRRGGNNQPTAEACRVCGSSTVHSREYSQPTMACVAYLRQLSAPVPTHKSMPRRFRWPIKNGHPNGTDAEWQHGTYFPQTDLCVTDMGNRSTGEPVGDGVEWIDNKPV